MPEAAVSRVGFDYASIKDEAVRAAVQQRAGRIGGMVKQAAMNIIAVGIELIQVKAVLPRGSWLPWLESEFGWGRPLASRFMRVAAVFGGSVQFAQFQPSALYLLAQENTPDPAREEAVKRAEAGETITYTTAKTIIEEHRLGSRTQDRTWKDGDDSLIATGDFTKLIEHGVKWQTVYADPPWNYSNQGTRAATDNHYGTMTLDDICALRVADIVADKAHLHLWTTNAFLFDAKAVIEAWGFEYKSVLVWVKPQMGIGNYWRVSHEFLLLGTRGGLTFRDHAQMSWREAGRIGHSRKPEEFRKAVETVGTAPRLELFARRLSEGWSAWGDRIEGNLFDERI